MFENNPGAPFAPFGPSAPPLPPLGSEADAPPLTVPAVTNSARSKFAPLIAGAAAVALVAGGVGGAVGFVLADRSAAPVASSVVVAAPGSIAALAAAVQPAVVQLNVGGQGGEGTGSGFVISEDGYVITNHHVVAGAGEDSALEVSFMDGSTATGRIVGSDPGYDIAVVKVDRAGLATVPLGTSSSLQVGESVIAIGSPLGLQGTVTSGIVSALDRPVTAGGGTSQTSFINAIQTDAAINPGNSGGPLINAAGSVVGVNSAIATMGQFGGSGSIGLGFAIPIDTVDRIVNEIINTGASSTPIIGVELDSEYSGDGARVAITTAGGPAAAGGVQDGDVITAINGRIVPDSTSLIVAIRAQAPGEQVTLTILRDGNTADYPVTLGTRSAE
jgi:putative serine protease PepD